MMRRLLLVALFIALPVDLAVVDAPLPSQAAARAAAWDDEEESAPSRRPTPAGEARQSEQLPPGSATVEPALPAPRVAHPSHGRGRMVAWLIPLRQAHLPAAVSASPSEDH